MMYGSVISTTNSHFNEIISVVISLQTASHANYFLKKIIQSYCDLAIHPHYAST